MNSTQIQTTLAPLLGVLAGVLATYLHVFDASTWQVVLAALFSCGGVIWGAVAARKSALISTTANMAEVKSVTLNASAPSALVTATPDNVNK